MAYSRLNGTILSHEFTAMQETPAPVSATDILAVWDNLLGTADSEDLTYQAWVLLGFGPGSFMFPCVVGSFLNAVTAIAAENPAADTRGVNALQSLLAIPLYYGQTAFAERLAMSSLPSAALLGNSDELNIEAGVARGAEIFLAFTQNQIVVDRVTVIVYVALGGLTLIVCFFTLGVATWSARGKMIPETSPFPLLDFLRFTTVREDVVYLTNEIENSRTRI
jgi:hypothetical protein